MVPNITISSSVAKAALAENGRIESQTLLRQRISEAAAVVIEGAVGNALRALVLTGSLARHEAGFDLQGERCKVRGDSEFLVVLQDRAVDISTRQKLSIVDKLQTELGSIGIDCLVSIGFVKAQYLANIRPHIFGYELRACGVVITGEHDILSLIPPFAAHDIPLEDGWQLLSNRIIEFMEYAHEWIAQPQAPSEPARYRMVKLYLDMATSFLLFESAYEPTYSSRADRLKVMAETSKPGTGSLPFSLQDFSKLVDLCTQFKVGDNLKGNAEFKLLRDNVDARQSLTATVNLAHGLWRWELAKLTGITSQLDDRRLIETWMRRQPMSSRLLGWGYVVRHSGWLRSWKQWPRWAANAWKASPRYWIYLVACELFFSLPILIQDDDKIAARAEDFQRLRTFLMLPPDESQNSPDPFQHLCSEIISNYRQFLEGTRA